MSESQLERGRQRLVRLRDRAERDAHADDPLLRETLEELRGTLEELSITLEELSSTKEELAEARLAAEEYARRYKDLFRRAPDGYVITDERGVIRELNSVAEQQLGRPGGDLVGKPLPSLVGPVDRDAFLECLAALRRGRSRLEDRLLRFGADPGFDASVSAVPERRDGGVEIRWTLRDVSELKERDAFRDEIERHLAPVLWLIQLDPVRNLHVSASYEAVWGRPVSSVYENPRAWIEQVQPEDQARVEAAFARLLEGEAFDEEYRIRRADGEVRWIHARGNTFESRAQINRAAGIAEDVTEKRRIEAALRETESRRRSAALAAERAEAHERRALAADLHDALGQSLALAQTKLAALRDEAGQSERAARLRDIESIIAEAAARTRTLTFRFSPPVLHDLGLAAATEWLAEDLRRSFGLHVHVEDTGLRESLPLEVRDALFRSLRELLINVARHARTDKANVRLDREGDALAITVEDGGIGFDIGRSGAAGFGLVSIRERLEALGGRLEIDSEPGRGTRARMLAPLAPEG